jgi:putative endonuclease
MMKQSFCYILWSQILRKFYVGATHDNVLIRLAKHNDGFYSGKSYTSQTDDWEIFIQIEATDFAHAVRIEGKIKSMKSSKYIRNLKRYAELAEKIKLETIIS